MHLFKKINLGTKQGDLFITKIQKPKIQYPYGTKCQIEISMEVYEEDADSF